MASSSDGPSTTQTTGDVTKKQNPYAEPAVIKCYRYIEPGHKSNECPNKIPVNLADYEGHEDVIDDDLSDADFTEGGDRILCIIRKLLCTPKVRDTSQIHQNFHAQCYVNKDVCNFIIDNGICENIAFRALVNHLKLSTEPHPNP